MPRTIALPTEERETVREEVLGWPLIVEDNFTYWGPPSLDEFAALREQLDRWIPELERLERDGEIAASPHVIAAVRERLESVSRDQGEPGHPELAVYLARLLEQLEAAAALDVHGNIVSTTAAGVVDIQMTPAECRAAARTIAVCRAAMAPISPPDGGASLAVAQRKLVDALKDAGVHIDGDVLEVAAA